MHETTDVTARSIHSLFTFPPFSTTPLSNEALRFISTHARSQEREIELKRRECVLFTLNGQTIEHACSNKSDVRGSVTPLNERGKNSFPSPYKRFKAVQSKSTKARFLSLTEKRMRKKKLIRACLLGRINPNNSTVFLANIPL